MSILNALKTSVLSAGFATVLFAGGAEAVSLTNGTIDLNTGAPNSPVSVDLIDGFTETTGNTSDVITFDAMVGDTLTFDFDFDSGESALDALFQDGSFFTLNGEDFLLASATEMGSVSFDIDTAGQNTLSFGVFNATSLNIPPIPGFPLNTFDNEVSDLSISNVELSQAQAVPEPATMLGLMAVAALGGSSVLKRKHS
jgi:hypothetical protein